MIEQDKRHLNPLSLHCFDYCIASGFIPPRQNDHVERCGVKKSPDPFKGIKQIDFLKELSVMADIVIIPFPVLTAIREQGIRLEFPNCVAFNATPETMRSAPDEKVVDISNWSY